LDLSDLLCATGVKSSNGFDEIEAFIILAVMWSSNWVAEAVVVDGSNSNGQQQSTNGWTAAKLYPIMDNHLNELFLWLKVRWVPNEWTSCFDAVLDEGGSVVGRRWH
jgi:hypothetical protein